MSAFPVNAFERQVRGRGQNRAAWSSRLAARSRSSGGAPEARGNLLFIPSSALMTRCREQKQSAARTAPIRAMAVRKSLRSSRSIRVNLKSVRTIVNVYQSLGIHLLQKRHDLGFAARAINPVLIEQMSDQL